MIKSTFGATSFCGLATSSFSRPRRRRPEPDFLCRRRQTGETRFGASGLTRLVGQLLQSVKGDRVQDDDYNGECGLCC